MIFVWVCDSFWFIVYLSRFNAFNDAIYPAKGKFSYESTIDITNYNVKTFMIWYDDFHVFHIEISFELLFVVVARPSNRSKCIWSALKLFPIWKTTTTTTTPTNEWNQMSNVVSKYEHRPMDCVECGFINYLLILYKVTHVSSLHSENFISSFFFIFFNQRFVSIVFFFDEELSSWERTTIIFLIIFIDTNWFKQQRTTLMKRYDETFRERDSVRKQFCVSHFTEKHKLTCFMNGRSDLRFENEWYNLHNWKPQKSQKELFIFIQFPFISFQQQNTITKTE